MRVLIGLVNSITLYAAPGFSSGSFCSLFHHSLGLEAWEAFEYGFFAALGPVYLTYASGWGMHRTLVQLLSWREAGLIQAREYDDLRRDALAWFRARRFGR